MLFKSLKGITFWTEAGAGGGGEKVLLGAFFSIQISTHLPPLSFLTVCGPNALPESPLTKSFPNLTVHRIGPYVFKKWGFLGLCFRSTGADPEGLKTILMTKRPSEPTTNALQYVQLSTMRFTVTAQGGCVFRETSRTWPPPALVSARS